MIMIVAEEWVKHVRLDAGLGMIVYSAALAVALAVAAPWWLWRMATSGRYREGLGQRLGRVPAALRAAIAGKRVVWLHAVSVGEVLAAERLVAELGAALGDAWVVVISTTTATGQKIARDRFGSDRVFYLPLDFAWMVRKYMRALRPELMVLMESEFWPRLLVECERAGIPVAVVNARVSDRSFPRYMRLRWLWKPLLGKVRLFLAQGEESAERLRKIGAPSERVRVSGNLKYDFPGGGDNFMVRRVGTMMWGSRLLVAGSTHEGEERALLDAWPSVCRSVPDVALMIAPRHPQRFEAVRSLMDGAMHQQKVAFYQCSQFLEDSDPVFPGTILLLNTIGDLASIYEIASASFIGGSLVPKGGQNPLEAARFGIPVVMGLSFENFREIADKMIAEGSLTITDEAGLAAALVEALKKRPRGPQHFEGQTGATQQTVAALLELLH
jgi:3-deoxy-D-manno-octulosonic-acid transferase